jgi:hypothetical protein
MFRREKKTMSDSKYVIADERIRPQVDPPDWVQPGGGDDRYGPDQVIGAYKAGVTTGIEGAFSAGQEWIRKTREHNAANAGQHTRMLLDRLLERGLHPLAAILNDSRFDAPEVMIVLPIDEYAGEDFTGMYSVIGELERQWTEPNYAISFSFTYQSDNLNYDLLKADGFKHFHRSLLGDEQGTRKTQRNTL